MPTGKYTSLVQRREPMSAADRKAVSEKAWLITAFVIPIGGLFLFIGISNLKESLQEFSAQKIATIFSYGKFIFSLLFILMPLGMFYYVYRAWQSTRLPEKIVYSGRVTGVYLKQGTSKRYATLNGVEFLIDGQPWDVVAEGDLAEFHCSRPGDIFTIRKISESELKASDRITTQRQIQIFERKTVQTARGKLARVGVFAAIFLGMQLYTCYTSWQRSYPPLELFTHGQAVETEVVRSNVVWRERKSQPRGKYYLAQVWIDLSGNRMPPKQNVTAEDDEEAPAQPRGFELTAIEETTPEFLSAAEAQKYLKAFPVGKKLTVYALDAQKGPFYAQRIFASGIKGLVARLVFDLAFVVVLVLAWRRWAKRAQTTLPA